jgi:hypothetical protein
MIHPLRECRRPKQIGRKGLSNGRWMVGVKFCPLLNRRGPIVEIVGRDAEGANAHDSPRQPLSGPAAGAV